MKICFNIVKSSTMISHLSNRLSTHLVSSRRWTITQSPNHSLITIRKYHNKPPGKGDILFGIIFSGGIILFFGGIIILDCIF